MPGLLSVAKPPLALEGAYCCRRKEKRSACSGRLTSSRREFSSAQLAGERFVTHLLGLKKVPIPPHQHACLFLLKRGPPLHALLQTPTRQASFAWNDRSSSSPDPPASSAGRRSPRMPGGRAWGRSHLCRDPAAKISTRHGAAPPKKKNNQTGSRHGFLPNTCNFSQQQDVLAADQVQAAVNIGIEILDEESLQGVL